ncbi:MAG: type I-E CRISPR-associated protein Cse1/CasA [Nitrospirales bacterium]|nr:type I-E CRISPR-associated protein Cse1/CasA [Nitrospirales bacterium]
MWCIKASHLPRKKRQFFDVSLGQPVWELFPNRPKSIFDRVNNATKTYIGRLVPISRWVRFFIIRTRCIAVVGFKYDTYKNGFPAEPTAAVRMVTKKDKKGIQTEERRVVKIDPTKALWRELSALIIKKGSRWVCGPLLVENAPREASFDFHVCAMTRDQASMDSAIESASSYYPSLPTQFTQLLVEEVMTAEEYS